MPLQRPERMRNVAPQPHAPTALRIVVKGIVQSGFPPRPKQGAAVRTLQLVARQDGIRQTQTHGRIVRPLTRFQIKDIVGSNGAEKWLFLVAAVIVIVVGTILQSRAVPISTAHSVAGGQEFKKVPQTVGKGHALKAGNAATQVQRELLVLLLLLLLLLLLFLRWLLLLCFVIIVVVVVVVVWRRNRMVVMIVGSSSRVAVVTRACCYLSSLSLSLLGS
mmetsp:Transcript_8368/g.17968  ORF Transcript_8368/g.17968 Transcript_8368/m.17968 type:complete len:219 (-) Transcript_8368:247-903(-)